MYTHISTHTYVHIYVQYMYTHMCTRIYVHTNMYTHICTQTYAHAYMYTHGYAHTHIYVHTYLYTHTNENMLLNRWIDEESNKKQKEGANTNLNSLSLSLHAKHAFLSPVASRVFVHGKVTIVRHLAKAKEVNKI